MEIKGFSANFIQDNHSHSIKGVLRGLHFQIDKSQGKLVRVLNGSVYDVAVDLRKDSSTFGKYFGIELSSDNHLMFYIPEGFAHGFLTLSDEVDFFYKVTEYYYPEFDSGIIWNDQDLKIDWPLESHHIEQPILSSKDAKLRSFKEVMSATK